MLTSQQAQERLATFKYPDGQARRKAAVDALDPLLRQVAMYYWTRDKVSGSPEDLDPVRKKIRPGLTTLQHTQVFDALLPGLGKLLAYVWDTQRATWVRNWTGTGEIYAPKRRVCRS